MYGGWLGVPSNLDDRPYHRIVTGFTLLTTYQSPSAFHTYPPSRPDQTSSTYEDNSLCSDEGEDSDDDGYTSAPNALADRAARSKSVRFPQPRPFATTYEQDYALMTLSRVLEDL